MTKELRESPIEQDFDFYVQDVMKTANRRGASLPRYSKESLENYMSCAELYLNVVQMEEDFNAVRCGDKKWQDVSSPKYCFDSLLVDSESVCSKTGENKDALSEALSEMLEEEVRFEFAKDCRSFIFWRRHYPFRGQSLRSGQGEAIRLLIDAAAQGNPDVPEREIRKILEETNKLPQTSELRNSFRSPPLWNTLLVSKKRGTRRLVFYPTSYELHD